MIATHRVSPRCANSRARGRSRLELLDMSESTTKHSFPNDDAKWAWVAGIIEGEGHILLSFRTNEAGRRRPVCRIAINMCDGDVLHTLAEAVGGNPPAGPYRHKHEPDGANWRPFWRFAASRRDLIESIITNTLPYMGERRSKKMQSVLDAYADYWEGKRPHGSRARYESGGCRCAACKAANAKRHREYLASKRTEPTDE